MKRLDRYVVGSFLTAWLAAFVFFAGLYLVIHFSNKVGDMEEAAESFRAQGFSAWRGFCVYYGLNLPFVLVQTAPYTILMGAMWAAQQMARRNELVPVLVAGVSFRRLAVPLLLTGFILALVFTGVRERLLPELAGERQRMERIYRGKDDVVIDRVRILRGERNELIHVKEYDVTHREARGVNVLFPDALGGGRTHFEAVRWTEERGWVGDRGENGDPEVLNKLGLRPRDIEIESRGLLFLDVDELQRLIARYPERSDLRALLHAHFAYPLSAVVLLLMGLPLVLKGSRRPPFVAAGASLLFSIAFFSVQSVMQDLGAREEILNPVLGAWLPIVIFGAAGLLMFETMST